MTLPRRSDNNIERDPRWAALCARDRAFDGRFVYSVKTTGVYCRPSCAARRPLSSNVRFHATCDDAERAGFRACLRCGPRSGTQAIRFAIGESSLGLVLVARSDAGLCAVLFGEDADELVRDLQSRRPAAALAVDAGGLQAALESVVDCIEAPHLPMHEPLDPHGTAFQMRVWQALRTIPAGSTVSYGELARRIGTPESARAVAAACAANPLAVVVPCHRVVAADGRVSGYRWGVARKRALLQREARA
ncbi:methylated-DNA--[protein]-cysteine S-methyltransferase [Lysobacter auxotrophicus]|uniref:Methylated-DNA--[protein]-cysteine S-methyltransferase n=1 Tax=Lysobacter auxotrophicus TaxID=2992573 RepID=A0ABN6UFP0_9GAMM|nr:methylated-DNA--[protein]-cysteine S-methyltransferase [Lysobacter auxotrophicus]BDU15089.1 methylated-DNA--[protein]-cysteine S-methyltransferase [Lysobacter auxotrophicus]